MGFICKAYLIIYWFLWHNNRNILEYDWLWFATCKPYTPLQYSVLMGAGYEEWNWVRSQSCWFSFLSSKFAQTWNWNNFVRNNLHKPPTRNTHTHTQRRQRFLLELAAEKLINKQLSEQEQSTTKQINTQCQRNDIWELNHFRELQSGITIPH